MDQEPAPSQHTPAQSLALHLLPGVLIAAAYFGSRPVLEGFGYPSIAALMLASALVLVPLELGYLLYQGKRLNGRFSLDGIVSYRRRISAVQYLIWLPLLFILLGIVFGLMKPIDTLIQDALLWWVPGLEAGLSSGYGQGTLIVTYAAVAVFGMIAGPLVEELYFRGHLLPRMGYAGKWAPVLHGFLFGLYHLWTPWMLATRAVGTLPLVWATKRKSLYLSIAVHVVANAVDLVAAIVFIAKMSG